MSTEQSRLKAPARSHKRYLFPPVRHRQNATWGRRHRAEQAFREHETIEDTEL
jgi:hypothetical protein